MTAFAGLPHTGCICMEGDDEKIQQMMGFAEEELDSRKKSFSQKEWALTETIVKVTAMCRRSF